MAYTKTNWQDRVVQKPMTFKQKNNLDGTVTLERQEGIVYQEGTPVNAANMNKIENALDSLLNPEPYKNITLQNGWTNYGSVDPTAQYYKDALGIVRIKGTIKGGTYTAGTTLFTLPVGYRPSQRHIHVAQSSDGFVRIVVEPSGVVSLFTAPSNNNWISLDSFTFRASS